MTGRFLFSHTSVRVVLQAAVTAVAVSVSILMIAIDMNHIYIIFIMVQHISHYVCLSDFFAELYSTQPIPAYTFHPSAE